MVNSRLCRKCKRDLPLENFRIVRCVNKVDWRETRCIECERVMRREWQNADYARNPKTRQGKSARSLSRYYESKNDPNLFLFKQVRQRARHRGIPFDLDPSDVTIPETCPVLGIKLSTPGGGLREESPTIDRLVPSRGYTKGNVAVISMKANRLKNDATIAEIERILAWMKARE